MSNFTQRVDVLDLLIKVLEEHEKKLDELITRLETSVEASQPLDDTESMIRFYERKYGAH